MRLQLCRHAIRTVAAMNKFMKKLFILLIIIIVIAPLIFIFRDFLFKSSKTLPLNSGVLPGEPEIVKVLPEYQDIEFQIEQTNSKATILWDSQKISIFKLILIDFKKFMQTDENPVIWDTASVVPDKTGKLPKRENIANFISSPYIIGEKREGFFTGEFETVNMEQGREYYLQLIGFDKEGNLKAASKTFKFGQK